jgi:hypothetical protein
MEEKSLDQLFTKEQLKEVKKLIEENKKRKLKPYDSEYTRRLRELFRKWDSQLMQKGVLPDYLAYAVAYKISQNPEAFTSALNLAIKNYKKVV